MFGLDSPTVVKFVYVLLFPVLFFGVISYAYYRLKISPPQYDELEISCMFVSVVGLFLLSPSFRTTISKYWAKIMTEESEFLIMFLIYAAGGMYSVLHLFLTREKYGFERYCMLIFSAVSHGFAVVAAGAYVISTYSTFHPLMLIPFFNLVEGGIILLALMIYHEDQRSLGVNPGDALKLADRDCSPVYAVPGLLLIMGVMLFSLYQLQLHWSLVLAIGVDGAMIVGKGTDWMNPRRQTTTPAEEQRE